MMSGVRVSGLRAEDCSQEDAPFCRGRGVTSLVVSSHEPELLNPTYNPINPKPLVPLNPETLNPDIILTPKPLNP